MSAAQGQDWSASMLPIMRLPLLYACVYLLALHNPESEPLTPLVMHRTIWGPKLHGAQQIFCPRLWFNAEQAHLRLPTSWQIPGICRRPPSTGLSRCRGSFSISASVWQLRCMCALCRRWVLACIFVGRTQAQASQRVHHLAGWRVNKTKWSVRAPQSHSVFCLPLSQV